MALKRTFISEFLSMNLVMAGMILVASLFWAAAGGKRGPLTPTFWFGGWSQNLRHGMSTVGDHAPDQGAGEAPMAHSAVPQ
jgi:hypothetical protein